MLVGFGARLGNGCTSGHAGAVIFGIGWGLAGICPGPGLVAMASGTWTAVPFVIAMLAGMLGLRVWRAWSGRRVPAPKLAAN